MNKLRNLLTFARTGMFAPGRPDRVVSGLRALQRWGPTPAGGYTVSARRFPDAPGLIDDLGTLTFGEIHERTNRLAHSLSARGVGPGAGVAIMCRNHRYFIDAVVACSKLGAHSVYLNTAFAGPQLSDVLVRERASAVIYDEEFGELLPSERGERLPRFLAWRESDRGEPSLDELIAEGEDRELEPPARHGRVVILTSGTTGTPRGAARHQPKSIDPAAPLLSVIPLRARETTAIAAPLFHSWGLAHFTIGMALSSTLLLPRRFDATDLLARAARHRASAIVVVPVMLQRLIELDAATLAHIDLGALRVIAASGSALPGDLALSVMDAFGEVLYNLYGSTEVAWATIATPTDLRAAPGTAGRPPRGTTVRLYDDQEIEVPRGATGRIFVTNEMVFEGYTGAGAGKPVVDGLISTGDVGHFDPEGRLFIDGRDDEMIVSGGENVFPREVEDLLAAHPDVVEVAVLGVADKEYGARLMAYLVLRPGAEVTDVDVKDHVRAHLARFKVPREVIFVEQLPRNATGKVLKRELAQWAVSWASAPGGPDGVARA